jgi:hypothetical protein
MKNGEEKRQIANDVLSDARMRILACKPEFKFGEFGVHGGLLFEEESITQTRNMGCCCQPANEGRLSPVITNSTIAVVKVITSAGLREGILALEVKV